MTTHTHDHSARCWWNSDLAEWVCAAATGPRPAAMEPDRPLVDVRDMIVVHTALLREFRLAPAAVARVGLGSTRQAAAVDRHLRFLCDMLHHHHAGEDELLWPKLRDRLPDSALRAIDDVEAQHAGIDAALAEVSAARARWVDGASATSRDELAARLGRLHALLKEHLDLEESAVLPLAASVLTDAEWSAIGDAAAAAMPRSTLLLAFGMFAYEGDPAVLKAMLDSAPAVPRLLVPRIAPRVYARRATQVHGTARP